MGDGRFNEILPLSDGRRLLTRVNGGESVSITQRMYWWTLGDTARTGGGLATPRVHSSRIRTARPPTDRARHRMADG